MMRVPPCPFPSMQQRFAILAVTSLPQRTQIIWSQQENAAAAVAHHAGSDQSKRNSNNTTATFLYFCEQRHRLVMTSHLECHSLPFHYFPAANPIQKFHSRREFKQLLLLALSHFRHKIRNAPFSTVFPNPNLSYCGYSSAHFQSIHSNQSNTSKCIYWVYKKVIIAWVIFWICA